MNKDMIAAVYDRTEYKLVPLKDLSKWVNAIVEDGYATQPTALIQTIVRFAPNLLSNESLFLYPFTADSDNVMEATEKVLLELLAKRKTADAIARLPSETKGPLARQFEEFFNSILGPVAKATPTGEMPAIPPRPAPLESDFAKGLSGAIDKFNAALARSEFAPRVSAFNESLSKALHELNDAGVKDDSSKPPMHLIDGYALEQLAMVLAFGAKKYAAHNWRNGLAQTRLISAAMRHLSTFNGGQDTDPETGLHHAAHAMCCCMFMVWMSANKPQFDDRYKGDAA